MVLKGKKSRVKTKYKWSEEKLGLLELRSRRL